jgi:hypothetical protein
MRFRWSRSPRSAWYRSGELIGLESAVAHEVTALEATMLMESDKT